MWKPRKFHFRYHTTTPQRRLLQKKSSAITDGNAGLVELHAAPPLKYTVEKAKGYDLGVVVLLDSLLSLRRFAKHPSHTRFVVLPFRVLGE